MAERITAAPVSLYEQDETAWLEQTADLIATGHFEQIDLDNLSEYLRDMARRDKREVLSRLVILMTHLLKWEHQPGSRSNSWRGTMQEQRRELRELLESKSLRAHAEKTLAKAYREAVAQAAAETGLAKKAFPAECGWALEDLWTKKST